MKTLVRWIDRLSAAGGVLAAVMLCAGLVLIAAEIVTRSFFDYTLYITEEYAGYLMCGLTFCALAYTLRDKGHIRMTFLLKAVKGRPRIYLDLVCFVIGLAFCVVLTWFTGLFFWDSVVSRSQSMQISETYLAVPQFFMPLGALLMTLQFFGEILRAILLLQGGVDEAALREESDALGR
ncbi:MAG: TRAP transporter small permease [Desulfobacteraceae bacterium]|jgi:TRAP-type C4-dicarboxylate transport system permease small subunit|nr:TRAP transporter small permease [Desulfobacteraceae bacterium]